MLRGLLVTQWSQPGLQDKSKTSSHSVREFTQEEEARRNRWDEENNEVHLPRMEKAQ